eukprot:6406136-Alexandrium_andersonii.AAC.1
MAGRSWGAWGRHRAFGSVARGAAAQTTARQHSPARVCVIIAPAEAGPRRCSGSGVRRLARDRA